MSDISTVLIVALFVVGPAVVALVKWSILGFVILRIAQMVMQAQQEAERS